MGKLVKTRGGVKLPVKKRRDGCTPTCVIYSNPLVDGYFGRDILPVSERRRERASKHRHSTIPSSSTGVSSEKDPTTLPSNFNSNISILMRKRRDDSAKALPFVMTEIVSVDSVSLPRPVGISLAVKNVQANDRLTASCYFYHSTGRSIHWIYLAPLGNGFISSDRKR